MKNLSDRVNEIVETADWPPHTLVSARIMASIISATEERLSAIEKRLDALEERSDTHSDENDSDPDDDWLERNGFSGPMQT